MSVTVGFIGTGNMGSALARAVCKKTGSGEILLANRTPAKAKTLARELDCGVGSNAGVAQACRFIFLGVKPQMMAGVLEGIAPILEQRKEGFYLVTMAAGLSCARIREMAGGNYPVIRIMPNTPAAVGAGVIQVCSLDVPSDVLAELCALLAPAGLVDQVPETQIDAASALSGCGPAFAYLFIEALADGAVACGLPRDKALSYAAQTVSGAAQMILRSGQHPGALKDAVCSPGGTTIQGVRALEQNGLRGAAMEAVIAAYEKTLELAKK